MWAAIEGVKTGVVKVRIDDACASDSVASWFINIERLRNSSGMLGLQAAASSYAQNCYDIFTFKVEACCIMPQNVDHRGRTGCSLS